MPSFAGSAWSVVVVVVVVVTVLGGLLLRYRSLERAGTPLPPGAGGARLVGTIGTVTTAHVPGERRGRVLTLGDDWDVADEVAIALRVGERVRVESVAGVRLVVARTVSEDGARPGPEDGSS